MSACSTIVAAASGSQVETTAPGGLGFHGPSIERPTPVHDKHPVEIEHAAHATDGVGTVGAGFSPSPRVPFSRVMKCVPSFSFLCYSLLLHRIVTSTLSEERLLKVTKYGAVSASRQANTLGGQYPTEEALV